MGFPTYKAGMTHTICIDNKPNSPTKGENIKISVTILETPPAKVLGIRAYHKVGYGSGALTEILAETPSQDLKRTIKLPKKVLTQEKLKDLETKLDKVSDIRLLINTQPKEAAFGKKKPEIMEIGVGGENVKQKFDYAKSVLGKDLKIGDIFKDGELVDAHGVTKGKGFCGSVKRFGVKLLSHKSEKARRKAGTLGAWHPAKTSWRVPQHGQLGTNTRTEYNKQILKISNNKELPVNPKGGFVNYGEVKGDYLLLTGSTPGPKKRTIIITKAIRPPRLFSPQPPEISQISVKSQQGM
jgi:large subunit ribosomal protein L3